MAESQAVDPAKVDEEKKQATQQTAEPVAVVQEQKQETQQAAEPAVQEKKQETQHAAVQVKQGAIEIKKSMENLPEHLPRKIREFLRTAKIALTDYSRGISYDAPGFLLKSHLWAAACLVGFFMGELVGKGAFSGVAQGMFGNWSPIMMLGIVVPLSAWGTYAMFANDFEMGNQLVLIASMVLGVLVGSVMNNRVLSFVAPPAAILPASVALSAYVAGMSPSLATDRRIFVPFLIGPAAFVYVLFGAQQLQASYVLYFSLLMAATVIDVQVKLDNANVGDLATLNQEQWKTVLMLAAADVVAYRILSDSSG